MKCAPAAKLSSTATDDDVHSSLFFLFLNKVSWIYLFFVEQKMIEAAYRNVPYSPPPPPLIL